MGPEKQPSTDENASVFLVKAPTVPENKLIVVEDIKIRKGQWINKGQLMLVLKISNRDLPDQSSKFRIKAESPGKVVEVCIRKGEETVSNNILARISLTSCPHSTLMKNMCADCGADLELEEQNQDKKSKIAMIHSIPELKISTDEAESLGREDERRLLANRRLVLLVDLDQTLIHTTNDNIPANIHDVQHFQLGGPQSPWYHTRIRPKTSQFLKNISKYYELHIFTYGARLYAHTVAKFLDQDSQLFSHRILSRDECFDSRLKTANLPSLFPCGDHMVCIIDDREDVWNFAPNLVHVKPYIFFKNVGDINDPLKNNCNKTIENSNKKDMDPRKNSSRKDKSSEKNNVSDKGAKETCSEDTDSAKSGVDNDEDLQSDTFKNKSMKNNSVNDDIQFKEDKDDYLLYLEDILKKIHFSYFKEYDEKKNREIPNLKVTIPRVKKQSLNGLSIVFSGLVSASEQLEKTKAFLVARSLGAVVNEKITKQTTHLIAARPGTAKVNEVRTRSKNIYLVTPDWLWCCAERWERIDERLYPVSKSSQITLQPPAHCSSPEDNVMDRINTFELDNHDSYQQSDHSDENVNPFYKLTSDEVKGMEQEVDDILSSDNSSSDSSFDTINEPMVRTTLSFTTTSGMKRPHPKENVSSGNETSSKCARSSARYEIIENEELGSVIQNISTDSEDQCTQSDVDLEKYDSEVDEYEKAMAMQVEKEFMEDESLSE